VDLSELVLVMLNGRCLLESHTEHINTLHGGRMMGGMYNDQPVFRWLTYFHENRQYSSRNVCIALPCGNFLTRLCCMLLELGALHCVVRSEQVALTARRSAEVSCAK
jgi:hypothetical protein